MEQQEFLHCCGNINQHDYLGNHWVVSFKFEYLPAMWSCLPTEPHKCAPEGMCKNGYGSLGPKSKKMKKTQMSIDKRVDKNIADVCWNDEIFQLFKWPNFSHTHYPGWNLRTIPLSEKVSHTGNKQYIIFYKVQSKAKISISIWKIMPKNKEIIF